MEKVQSALGNPTIIRGKKTVDKFNLDTHTRCWKKYRVRPENRDANPERTNATYCVYDAMNKYGIEHFHIKPLEECSMEDSNDREIYWIEKLNTYRNGYNATLGGESKRYYNYKEIADKYLELKNQKETAEYFNCDILTVRKACKNYNIEILPSHKVSQQKLGKKICCLDKNNNIVKNFSSIKDAAKWCVEEGLSNETNPKPQGTAQKISLVAKGKRKTAFKHKWQFIK